MADPRPECQARRICSDKILLSALARDCRGAQPDEAVFPRDHRAGDPAAVPGVRTDQPLELRGDAPSAAGRARQCCRVRMGHCRDISNDRAMRERSRRDVSTQAHGTIGRTGIGLGLPAPAATGKDQRPPARDLQRSNDCRYDVRVSCAGDQPPAGLLHSARRYRTAISADSIGQFVVRIQGAREILVA